ncbi:capsid protein 3 [Moumouvirus australiensis]|uniref:Capsid protein 3 n=1 Tax=Moumouvirus australiensis TaxID=2109587 RepID=A0A2P1ELK7_9VIRU|nr:capsid protein 3 [Moumouvirus australiensis]AVL94762.1 capsid protein 3 [Moumouvirus australiensis]
MGGGILQLVANSDAPQNIYLNTQPQISFFKKVYRRHTQFAREMIPVYFKTNVDFGKSASLDLPSNGDLVHRMFLAFEIPEIRAKFFNTKNKDIINFLMSSNIYDNLFYNEIVKYINEDFIEYDKILDLIELTSKQYHDDEEEILNILQDLKNNNPEINTKNILLTNKNNNFNLETETYSNIYQNIYNKNDQSNILIDKLQLMDKFMNHKKSTHSIYELVKLIYLIEKDYVDQVPLINGKDLPGIILNCNIFKNIFTNKEIQTIFNTKYPNNYTQKPDLYNKISQLQNGYQNIDDRVSDLYFIKKKLDINNDKYYDFGSEFYHILNNYNIIKNLLNTLSKTVPIIVFKPIDYDSTNKQRYSTLVDPNFKSKFFYNLNTPAKYSMDPNIFEPINLYNTNDFIYPNNIPNLYFDYVNEQAENMYNTIQSNCDILFKIYNDLFTSKNKLMFNNTPPISNIYNYLINTSEENQVVNINIWFFYFFKYLDLLNETVISNYLRNETHKISENGQKIIEYLIILLKINLDYYMHEISYLLNDLYSSSPSTNISEKLTDYVPMINEDQNTTIVSIIFHRNIVPTILEIFQFIYHFISTISLKEISERLDVYLEPVSVDELLYIRNMIKLLYYNIYKYFMDKYDFCNFETSANFSTDEYDGSDNKIIENYVKYFLTGTKINNNIMDKQSNLSKVISQMEFYFILEMINMRQQQKFYFNTLSNSKILNEKAGSTVCGILNLINKSIKKNNIIDLEKIKSQKDSIRKYYDTIFSNSISDKIYYSTFDTARYSGESYINTPYESRFFGNVPKKISDLPLKDPIPLPNSNPYGVNQNYYDHNQTIDDYSMILNPELNFNTNIPVNFNEGIINNFFDNQNEFQLYEIDFFRLRHDIIEDRGNYELNNININEYDFNLLKLLKLCERFIEGNYDNNMYYWLFETIKFIVKNISPNDYPYNLNTNVINILNDFLIYIHHKINNITTEKIFNLDDLKTLSLFLSENIKFNIFKIDDLCQNNQYIENYIFTTNNNNTILENLAIMKNNFLAQYYIFLSEDKLLNNINNNISNNDKYSFVGILPSVYQIIGVDNYNNIQARTSIYLYPDKYLNEITNTKKQQKNLSDLQKKIINYYENFLTEDSINLLTDRDIFNIINTTFTSCISFYRYLIENNIYDLVLGELKKYQLLMLQKLSIYNDFVNYFNNHGNKYLDENNINDLIIILGEKESNNNLINYFKQIFIPKYNNYLLNSQHIEKIILINMELNRWIETYLIQKFLPNLTFTRFKDIITRHFTSHKILRIHPELVNLIYFIGNEYLLYLYFFLQFNKKNNISPNKIINPLVGINKYTIKSKINTNMFTTEDFLSNLLEYIFEDTLTNHQRYEININNSQKVTDEINQAITTKKLDNNINNNEKILNIIEALKTDIQQIAIEKYIQELSQDSISVDLENINNKTNANNILIEACEKIIVIINQYKNNLNNLKNKISTILYRNKQAKTAWIRKLAHYLVEEVNMKCGDQLLDCHISDWFEVYNDISQSENHKNAYMKMIGHCKDLIEFNDSPKKSYTIVLPLIFYFNKKISSSLPLNASINVKYQLNLRLRNLDDVIYKEEFSDFVDPNNINDTNIFKPHIIKAYLMCEYIYLGNEERKIFVTNRLQYLMDELQYNIVNTNDIQSVSIYKVGTKTKNYFVIENGIKTKKEKYIDYVYLPENEINMDDVKNKLIPRQDVEIKSYETKSGIHYTKAIENKDNFIHSNRITVKNHFENPTKLVTVLVKPNIHTDPEYRKNDSNYFYGERQWDNFGVNSYYDLSKIHEQKLQHYSIMHAKIKDLDDPTFGFIYIVNDLLQDYTGVENLIFTSKYEKWIKNNKEYFLQTLQKIKEKYMNYHGEIIYNTNIIKLKENLISLNIDYPIYDYDSLIELIKYIYCDIGEKIPTDNIMLEAFKNTYKNFDWDNIYVDKTIFRNGMFELLKYQITNDKNIDFEKLINFAYNQYNEYQVNLLLIELQDIIDLNDFSYDMVNIINTLYDIYSLRNNNEDDILNILEMIHKKINNLNEYEITQLNNLVVKYEVFKDVIYQISNPDLLINYSEIIPQHVINIIAYKMTQKMNKMIDNYKIDIINYKNYLIENPKINPLTSGYMSFNGFEIMPKKSDSIMWSEMMSYQYFNHSSSCGINSRSLSIYPLKEIISGSANLSRIDDFSSTYYLNPNIDNNNPAKVITMTLGINLNNYISGMCGKAW